MDGDMKGLATLSDNSSSEKNMETEPFMSLSKTNKKIDDDEEDEEFMTDGSFQIIYEDDKPSDESELSDNKDINNSKRTKTSAATNIKKLIALEKWSKERVENKEEAAQLAKRCSSFKQAEEFIRKDEEKQKQLRQVQCEHQSSSRSGAEKCYKLSAAGYGETESVRAIRDGKVTEAERRVLQVMSFHDLSMDQSLAAIELMDFDNCEDKMACFLAKTLDMKGAKERWKEFQKKMGNYNFSLANDTLKTGQQVSWAMDLFEMGFDQKDILEVADSCDSVDGALALLNKRDCAMCLDKFTVKNMLTLMCGHEMCKPCGKIHFTTRIKERSVMAIVCPFPDCALGNNDLEYEYFNFLEQLLKPLVEKNVFELFEKKLRNRAFESQSENYIYCSKCPNAFLLGPNLDKINCPDCRHPMCAKCKADWEPNHEGKTCAQVCDLATAGDSETAFANVLGRKGIECSKCKNKFELIQGGCMHMKCASCQFEFCKGCGQQYWQQGAECGGCNIKGLHAHHPRHCQYYLRDYEVKDLEGLFKSKEEIPAVLVDATAADGKTCQIVVQEKLYDNDSEEKCGEALFPDQPTLCERHYKEHLCTHIIDLNLDPALLMGVPQLRQELTRHKREIPIKAEGEDEMAFRTRLIQCVVEQVPLHARY